MQSKTFRLFISSTFSDFNEERRLLQTYVFPEIKRHCSELNKGYTFQPIDLRWGVSNEAQLDQKTLELCINEVHASKLQPHPNFLIMAGDRYGWVPCPYAIEEEEFKAIKKQVEMSDNSLTIEYKEYKLSNNDTCETDDKGSFDKQDGDRIFKPNDAKTTKIELLEKWYKLDENQIPPSYILQERVNNKHSCYESYQYWEAEENALREILQAAVKDATSKEKYFDSATEQEVFNGIIKYKNKTKFQKDELINKNKDYESLDESHVYGYIRNIDTVGGSKPESDTEFFDKESLLPKVKDFKQQVKASIEDENLLEVDANLTNFNKDKVNKSLNYEYDAIGTKLDKNSEENSEFVQKMLAYLKQSINDFDKDIESIGLDTPEAIEAESQRVFKDDKAKGFIGREDNLEVIQSYIESGNNQALVIYGPSGMGKSALMAKAIERTENKRKDKQKTLYRFVASMASLSTSVEVLTSILKELGIEESIQITKNDFGQNKPEDLDKFFARIAGHLSSLTEQATIFIDAVDQFTNKESLKDNHEFIWLPKQLPDNLKIVISALEDDKYPEDSNYLALLKTKISNQDNLHKLDPFNDKHAEEMINGVLKGYGRSITSEQQSYLFGQPNSKQPLYLSIAVEELKHWKSTDTTKTYQTEGQGQDLAPTQREIINEYIQNLTELYHHDQELVHRVMSYIHLTDGLSESELLEILSTDEEFIDHIAPDTYHNKTEKTLPVVIWARLHTQLKPFLKLENKDDQEAMKFFHREFDSIVGYPENRELLKLQYDKLLETHKQLIDLIADLLKTCKAEKRNDTRYQKLWTFTMKSYIRKLGHTKQSLNDFDVSNVKDMSGLFDNAEFCGDISEWDVSNVVYMREMFKNSQFNESISNWNVSNVTGMRSMFSNSVFNSDISDWDVSNVIDMSTMFKDSQFKGNISNWNVSNVKNMGGMFLSSIFDSSISDWNVSNVENMKHMFQLSKFNKDINKWKMPKVESMFLMFDASQFNSDISDWDVSNVTDMQSMFSNSVFNKDIERWEVGNVKNMIEMFRNSSFNQGVSKWDVSKVSKMIGIFDMLKNNTINIDISNWSISADDFDLDPKGLFTGTGYSKSFTVKRKSDKRYFLNTYYYKNGDFLKETTYGFKNRNPLFKNEFNKDNEKHGIETWWYESGTKEYEINYKAGEKDGLETQWYENGQKQSEINYKDGKSEGLVKWWHDDGSKYVEVNFKNGERHGKRTFFDENGVVTFSGTYDNGKSKDQNGLEPQYDENGELTHYAEYIDGVVVNNNIPI